MEYIEQILNLASKKFQVPVENLDPSRDIFESLNINSIQALSLLSELEQTFSVEIMDFELQDVKSFQDLANLIEEKSR
ncbi:MAG: acyl carrier protein [Bdellovibrionales bacterium]|nr:acyl carrier protein [Bdellovibrionales bacterium]